MSYHQANTVIERARWASGRKVVALFNPEGTVDLTGGKPWQGPLRWGGGGGRKNRMGNLVKRWFLTAKNWPRASLVHIERHRKPSVSGHVYQGLSRVRRWFPCSTPCMACFDKCCYQPGVALNRKCTGLKKTLNLVRPRKGGFLKGGGRVLEKAGPN